MAPKKGSVYPWDAIAAQNWTCENMMSEARNAMESAKDEVTRTFTNPSDKLKSAHVFAMLAVAAAIRNR